MVRLDPSNAEAFFYQGNLLRAVGEPQEAIQSYDRAIELNPEHAWAYAHRAVAFALSEDPVRTNLDIERAVELGLDRNSVQGMVEEVASRP